MSANLSIPCQFNDAELLIHVLDAMPALIFVVDRDVRVLEYNRAAGAMLSGQRDKILRRPGGEILQCIHSFETPAGCGHSPTCCDCVVRNSVRQAFDGRTITRCRTRMELGQGPRARPIDILVTASPLRFRNESLALLTLEDIGDLAELERLVPICSMCHKIRNDGEYWQQVESYFKRHWDQGFSRSYCPECLVKVKGDAEDAIPAASSPPPPPAPPAPAAATANVRHGNV
ncbi:MAG TPA: PAS domain-containing protein, partial [Candidatus Paceibacterota bacterium]|nr:PAS domain-containing protein [Candidatus Paceibacterota bacterium]